jgi:hypothetical protein
MSDASKSIIFGTILRGFLANFEGGIVAMTDDIVNASIEVFATIARDLLPTPSKSHYTFNLRDLAKVSFVIFIKSVCHPLIFLPLMQCLGFPRDADD